jgi:tRNA(Leu) C34 or U34 (ribose-2'-O)-methylase TrmL
MRRYGDVDVIRCEEPLRAFGPGATPVAVEVTRSAEIMPFAQWPDNPVIVFGPEDGSLPDWARRNCHRHMIIPTEVCLNLGNAVAIALYDWKAKRMLSGAEPTRPSWQTTSDQRGFWDADSPLDWVTQ